MRILSLKKKKKIGNLIKIYIEKVDFFFLIFVKFFDIGIDRFIFTYIVWIKIRTLCIPSPGKNKEKGFEKGISSTAILQKSI